MVRVVSWLRDKGVVWANPWWIVLMLVGVVLANVRFGALGSRQVGWDWSWLAVAFVVVALIPVVLPSRTVDEGNRRPGAPTPVWAWAWVAGTLVSLLAGLVVYGRKAPALEVIAVELGGSGQTLPDVDLSASLSWDFALIVGYGTALWMATTAATWVFWTPRAARLARLARWLTVLTVLCDMAENLCLGLAWTRPGPRPWLLDVAAVFATVKFSVLLPAALISIVALLVIIGRLVSSVGIIGRLASRFGWRWLKAFEDKRWDWSVDDSTLVKPAPLALDGLERPVDKRLDLSATARDERAAFVAAGERDVLPPPGGGEQRWKAAYNVPGLTAETLADDASDRVGVCLSGGGVRSASLAMGFLQTMRQELRDARYLVSISGGGYTSGALLQALTPGFATDESVGRLPEGARVVRDAETAYQPGTVEYDHLRRHSSYISATVREMLVALAVLARGVVASLTVLFAPAVALGIFVAWIYHLLPLSVLPAWSAQATQTDAGVLATTARAAGLSLPGRDVYAVLAVGVLALALWLLRISTQDARPRLLVWVNAHAEMGATFAAFAAVVVGVVAVGIPILLWATRWLGERISVPVGVGTSVGGVVLSYVASLAALLWRKRTQITAVLGSGGGGKPSKAAAVPRGLLQLLLVIAALGVLCALWLLLFGAAALAEVSAIADGASSASVTLAVALVLLVVVLGAVFDESSLSLHPFYRGRLASAFATRRVQLAEGAPPVAVPYDPHEGTSLSRYAVTAPDDGKPYPEVIFAAAANLTGEHRTPSGLTAVSFVMSASWCGGPDVGWVHTPVLEQVSTKRLRRDLTVQAAVAISGAAFASAMGRFARWYQLLLAVTGARLGAWLPNPVFVAQMRDARRLGGGVTDWTLPGLPRVRRLSYLLREVFNLHPAGDRLLEVTDGGHYENLGIVELLRRRCTTIYCVDGGGDVPPTAQGLSEAIALARAELGVTVTLDNAWASEPGSGAPLQPQAALTALNARLSQTPVITGTFTYPEASGLPAGARRGRLFVARALLSPDMPYELMSYAAQHPEFPHDSTSDQWFEDGQFNAYTELGRQIGLRTRAASAAAAPDESPGATPQELPEGPEAPPAPAVAVVDSGLPA